MREAAGPLTVEKMRWGAFWRGPVPALPPRVLSPAGGEIVVGGLTHPHVPNTQHRAQGGMGLGGAGNVLRVTGGNNGYGNKGGVGVHPRKPTLWEGLGSVRGWGVGGRSRLSPTCLPQRLS